MRTAPGRAIGCINASARNGCRRPAWKTPTRRPRWISGSSTENVWRTLFHARIRLTKLSELGQGDWSRHRFRIAPWKIGAKRALPPPLSICGGSGAANGFGKGIFKHLTRHFERRTRLRRSPCRSSRRQVAVPYLIGTPFHRLDVPGGSFLNPFGVGALDHRQIIDNRLSPRLVALSPEDLCTQAEQREPVSRGADHRLQSVELGRRLRVIVSEVCEEEARLRCERVRHRIFRVVTARGGLIEEGGRQPRNSRKPDFEPFGPRQFSRERQERRALARTAVRSHLGQTGDQGRRDEPINVLSHCRRDVSSGTISVI